VWGISVTKERLRSKESKRRASGKWDTEKI
jgi:hypothetical protein